MRAWRKCRLGGLTMCITMAARVATKDRSEPTKVGTAMARSRLLGEAMTTTSEPGARRAASCERGRKGAGWGGGGGGVAASRESPRRLICTPGGRVASGLCQGRAPAGANRARIAGSAFMRLGAIAGAGSPSGAEGWRVRWTSNMTNTGRRTDEQRARLATAVGQTSTRHGSCGGLSFPPGPDQAPGSACMTRAPLFHGGALSLEGTSGALWSAGRSRLCRPRPSSALLGGRGQGGLLSRPAATLGALAGRVRALAAARWAAMPTGAASLVSAALAPWARPRAHTQTTRRAMGRQGRIRPGRCCGGACVRRASRPRAPAARSPLLPVHPRRVHPRKPWFFFFPFFLLVPRPPGLGRQTSSGIRRVASCGRGRPRARARAPEEASRASIVRLATPTHEPGRTARRLCARRRPRACTASPWI